MSMKFKPIKLSDLGLSTKEMEVLAAGASKFMSLPDEAPAPEASKAETLVERRPRVDE